MKNWLNLFKIFRRFSFSQKKELLCTLCSIVVIKTGLKFLSFTTFKKKYDFFLRYTPSFSRRSAEKVNFKIFIIQKIPAKLPFSFLCLGQGLALKYYLRRESDYLLKIGVKLNERKDFAAHAWITKDNKIIIGDLPELKDFKIIWEWQ